MLETFIQISKLFIPVIAIAGVYIAWQQFTANRDKIRLDLYDKRFKIYHDIVLALENLAWGWDDDKFKNYAVFETACNEAEFLLPEHVCENIRICRKHFKRWHSLNSALEYAARKDHGSEKSESVRNEICEIEKEIEDFIPKLTESFKSILKFEKF